jgi:phosphomethylpyrimidine synthase
LTQIDLAKKGIITEEIKQIAKNEKLTPEAIRRGVENGRIVIMGKSEEFEDFPPLGVGNGLTTKTNANVGTSPEICDIDIEIEKARVAMDCGADSIMDLSTGGDVDQIRKMLRKNVNKAFGTVPIYQAGIEARRKKGSIIHMNEDDIFGAIEKHAKDGVDFITVHCGVTKNSVDRLIRQKRLLGIVSRGGTFLAAWIIQHAKENPLYENYDYLLEIAKEYDVVLSLGDGLRPGCIHDATDSPQIEELIILGELVQRARNYGVQCIVEGPGHIPLDQIKTNVEIEKSICKGAPFYVLGPIVTDIAPGYDHIVAAIGGAIAGSYGADFLCYVTPSEHIALPSIEEVKEGILMTKMAAHIADLTKRREIASIDDYKISKARADFNWDKQYDFALDPKKLKEIRNQRMPKEDLDSCTMCGEFCAIKILKKYLIAEH